MPGEYIPFSDCEICGNLNELEKAYSKVGWEDRATFLPPAADRLQPLSNRKQTLRCPICGMHYRRKENREYLVNGSEEETELYRLTPTGMRKLIGEEEYNLRIAHAEAALADPHLPSRRYAAKCMAAYAIEHGEPERLDSYLLHPDLEVVRGTISHLIWMVDNDFIELPEFARHRPALESLTRLADEQVSGNAGYLLLRIKDY